MAIIDKMAIYSHNGPGLYGPKHGPYSCPIKDMIIIEILQKKSSEKLNFV